VISRALQIFFVNLQEIESDLFASLHIVIDRMGKREGAAAAANSVREHVCAKTSRQMGNCNPLQVLL
jgi:hypothetical protein